MAAAIGVAAWLAADAAAVWILAIVVLGLSLIVATEAAGDGGPLDRGSEAKVA